VDARIKSAQDEYELLPASSQLVIFEGKSPRAKPAQLREKSSGGFTIGRGSISGAGFEPR
jgi:hypothetical protein